ncbi:MAG: replication initiator protein A [Clostridia bacterium]|nr:replication initiator protein A [Clostridia bacterium]
MNKQNEASGAFFIIPKTLMSDPKYSSLSVKAKMLYGLMLDRMKLSEMNGWRDEDGKTYIYFSISEIKAHLSCGNTTAVKLLRKLESAGLIKKQSDNKGTKTKYIVFNSEPLPNDNSNRSRIKNTTVPENGSEPFPNVETNNTEKNNTELSNTLFCVEEEVKENIDYDCLIGLEDKADIDSIVGIITDALTTENKHIRIGSEVFRKEDVRKRLLSLNDGHISYVLEALHTNKTPIRDIRAYILKLLFYAPTTMNIFYSAKFCSDRNGEVV